MALEEKFSLPGYEILEKAGKGGMAVVWTARQLSLDRIVAIKVLNRNLVRDGEAQERFHFEAQAAARLRHPGIVQVYDAGEHGGQAYYVMEYVPGVTLAELLEQKKRLAEKHALAMTEGVILALKYAWDKEKLIHCDVKPGNIMIERDGTVKVADLGLARIASPLVFNIESDDVLGTPNYTSPEQARNEKDLDCRTDIYSLGATLYHTLTGHIPFIEIPWQDILKKQLYSYLPEPLELNPTLSQEAGWLLEKMLVKDRTLRYRNWDEVLEDVEMVARGGMPARPFPDAGKSTVLRGDRRNLELTPKQKANTQHIAIQLKEEQKPEVKQKQKIVLPKDAVEQLRVQPGKRKKSPVKALLLNIISLAVLLGGGYGVMTYILQRQQAEDAQPTTTITRADLPPGASVITKQPTPEPARAPARQHSPAREPTVQAPKPQPPAPTQEKPVITWKDPRFLAGAKAFNEALATYQEYQQTKENPAILRSVEQKCRTAIEAFESCKRRAPEGVDIDDYINRCYHLISDCRQSMLINTDTRKPSSRSSRSPKAQPPQEPEYRNLKLSPTWNMGALPKSKALDDLHEVLKNNGIPERSLEAAPSIHIRGDITYLMPLKKALELIGGRASSRRLVDCPGFPDKSFFYYTLNGDFGNGFNRMLLITDSSDRIVGVQLCGDAPDDKLWFDHYLYQDNWSIYNFIEKKGKGHAKWRIGHRVQKEGQIVVIDSELVTHDPQGYFELGQSKGRTSLRLPDRIVNLILYRIEQK
ncbi:MAG: serine/threonine protein kinase [Spartobacteria bacterium]|nr:serine/threonine protein kinase [Spartobacteria bacterium]